MILYIILLGTIAWPSSRCEPPVNSYLPPSGSGSGGNPTSQFRPPGRNGGQQDSQPGGELTQKNPQDSYSTGQNGPSIDTQYGPPSLRKNGQGSQGFRTSSNQGGFNNGRGSSPSSQYGAPDQPNGDSPQGGSSKHGRGNGNRPVGLDNSGFGQGPQTSYGPPPTGFGDNEPTSQRLSSQGTPDSTYLSPNSGSPSGFGNNLGGRQTQSPSSSYGTPGFGVGSNGESNSNGQGFGGGNGGFGGISGRSQNYEEGESNEPAKYEFSYDVDDAQTGTKFGHSEQRDGDLATGEYNVVLPDGRKQVVEYEAGTQGYKPQIRYEGGANAGSGSGFGGGIGGASGQSGSQGYSQGGPNSSFGTESAQDQEPHSGRYQEGGFGDGDSNSVGFAGYPSGRPGVRNGAGSRNPGQDPHFSSGNGVENLNGNQGNGYASSGPGGSEGGYPKGGPGKNGGGTGRNGSGEGYQRGGSGRQQGGRRLPNSQNGSGGQPGSQNGSEEGYPSGGPSGPRGTGY